MELYISAYNEVALKGVQGLIRLVGRRVQKPLWGRRHTDIYSKPESLLFLDHGGRLWDVVSAERLIGTTLREYIVYKDGGKVIHIVSEPEKIRGECDGSVLAERIRQLDKEYRSAVFTVIEADPLRRMSGYREKARCVKNTVTRGIYSERLYSSLIEPHWLSQTDVFVTDEYTMSAVLMALTGKDEPVLVHLMSRESDVYVPFSSIKPSCFIPKQKAIREAVYGISEWLYKIGVTGFSKRMKRAADENGDFEEIAKRISVPVRRRKPKKEPEKEIGNKKPKEGEEADENGNGNDVEDKA